MRIGIDARFYGPVGKGLGRYTQEVVDNILRLAGTETNGPFEYVIFLSPENFDEFIVRGQRVKKVRLNCRWYSWREQVFMPFYLWREKLDLMHFPHFNVPLLAPAPFVVTIHDLILTHFPTLRATTRSALVYRLKDLAYRLVIRTALRRAEKVITVSEFTKQDIIARFRIAPEKIAVTLEGVTNLARGSDTLFVSKLDRKETLDRYHIPDKFLLYVGNAYPHKNLDALLEAFKVLSDRRPGLRLVLVGKIDHFYQRIQAKARALGLWRPDDSSSAVIFPGYVPDEQLEVLYASARLYIFPSLYEGFGLPPLEAMAQSCPVVSSDRASMPEILGEAASYFNPEKPQEMIAAMEAVLDNPDKQETMKMLGRERAKRYSWLECARQTWQIYKSVLNI